MKSKILLRRVIKKKLRAQSSRARRRKSRAVEKKLFGVRAFKKARCVCFYVSTPVEVDTRSMIDRALRAGKRVLVPRVRGRRSLALYEIIRRDGLKKGAFGIHEPNPAKARRARVTETVGEMTLELEGTPENLERGIKYLESRGIKVEPVAGDIAL